MLIDLSTSVIGDYEVRAGSPRVEAYFDVRLVPLRAFPDDDPFWGVYKQDGALIEAAAYTRGPGRKLLGQSDYLSGNHDFTRVDGVGIYGGFGHLHFGHYLLSTLSRFWVKLAHCYPGSKIYMHIVGNFDHWYEQPFVNSTLTALGIGKDDIVPIRNPIILKHLIIPAPALVEQSHAYKAYDCIGNLISSQTDQRSLKRKDPVYFSKERLNYGVSKVVNENEISSVLSDAGVRIVYPEELSITEQIAIFDEHETIMGLAGSAFHLSVLTKGAKRLIGICDKPLLNSNFLMIDSVKNNISSYFYPENRVEFLGKTDHFQNNYRIIDAKVVAQEVLGRVSWLA